MQAKKDRNGKPVTNGSPVKWVGGNIDLSRAHRDGYKDVHNGDRGRIVNINHRSGPDMILVLFNGHKKPVSLAVKGFEKI